MFVSVAGIPVPSSKQKGKYQPKISDICYHVCMPKRLPTDCRSLAGREKVHGDSKMQKQYQSLVKAGERPGFMIEGQIQDLLAKYKFDIIEEVNSAQLAGRYFNKENFEPAAQTFRIIKAIKEV